MAPPVTALAAVFEADVQRFFEGVFGRERFSKICGSLVLPPRTSTLRATRGEVQGLRDAEELLEESNCALALQGRKPIRARVSSRVAGMIEIESAESVLPSDFDSSSVKGCRVVVDRACGEAVLRGSPIYAPGILAMSKGTLKDSPVVILVATTKKGCTRGQPVAQFQNDALLFVGLGRMRVSRKAIFGYARTLLR
eukprot:g4816.t1